MIDYGTRPEPAAIRFERRLPGPIERVWSYLVDPEKRGRWLAAGPIEPRAGGRLELHFHNAKLAPPGEPVPEQYRGHAGEITSQQRILRYEPPHVLAFTWSEPADGSSPSEVTFELSAEGDEVRLALTHRRLARGELLDIGPGWHLHLGVLEARLRGEEPKAFWSVLARLEPEYRRRFSEEA